ncbi:MAG: type II toxin-antitoxin system PemK/MazF family toxin [Chthonomonadetes bacterium]|jgi:mRNA interferase MazF|nr:type II toxin-antitoxin system PemK/MazF family toxin [Chthonomonadetes bacterium]
MDGPYEQGDIVLVDFPYSDASGSKQRPAIVLSTDEYHKNSEDVILVAITSKEPKTFRSTDYFLQDWLSEGLDKPSWVRSTLITAHRSRIVQKIGRLTERDLQGVKQCIRRACGL